MDTSDEMAAGDRSKLTSFIAKANMAGDTTSFEQEFSSKEDNNLSGFIRPNHFSKPSPVKIGKNR